MLNNSKTVLKNPHLKIHVQFLVIAHCYMYAFPAKASINFCFDVFLAQQKVNSQGPFFSQCPKDGTIVQEGRPLVLKCQQNKETNVAYTWAATNERTDFLLPDWDIPSSPRRSYRTGGPGDLTIHQVDRILDSYYFHCMAHRDGQSQQCSTAKVTVSCKCLQGSTDYMYAVVCVHYYKGVVIQYFADFFLLFFLSDKWWNGQTTSMKLKIFLWYCM